jgi:hypothetical protein
MGEGVEDANTNLQSLVWLWNTLVEDHEGGRVRLSPLAFANPPSVHEPAAAVQRRSAEITWFPGGLDAGGDESSEFGTDGERAFRGLGETGAFLRAYEELLGRVAPAPSLKELEGAHQSIEQLTGVVEGLIEEPLTTGDDVRREALAAPEARGERPCDDELPPRRASGSAATNRVPAAAARSGGDAAAAAPPACSSTGRGGGRTAW